MKKIVRKIAKYARQALAFALMLLMIGSVMPMGVIAFESGDFTISNTSTQRRFAFLRSVGSSFGIFSVADDNNDYETLAVANTSQLNPRITQFYMLDEGVDNQWRATQLLMNSGEIRLLAGHIVAVGVDEFTLSDGPNGSGLILTLAYSVDHRMPILYMGDLMESAEFIGHNQDIVQITSNHLVVIVYDNVTNAALAAFVFHEAVDRNDIFGIDGGGKLEDAEKIIRTEGKLLYSPRIDNKTYYVYQVGRLDFNNNSGVFTPHPTQLQEYLLDSNSSDAKLVLNPSVLIKAKLIHSLNGSQGFTNTTRYREGFSGVHLIDEERELIRIRNTLIGLNDTLSMISILTDFGRAIQDFYTAGKTENPIDAIKFFKEIRARYTNTEADVSALQYAFIHARGGINELIKENGVTGNSAVFNIIFRQLQNSQYIANYEHAVRIEKYDLLKNENKILQPLTLKYFRSHLLGPVLSNRSNEYAGSLVQWMGSLPAFRYPTQSQIKLLAQNLLIERESIFEVVKHQNVLPDRDIYDAIESLTRLESEFQKKILPTNIYVLGNESLAQLAGIHITFNQTVSIKCPVDVAVYNSSGEKIGAISSGIIDETIPYDENNPLVLFVEDGTKTLIFPSENDYRIEISAYDDGVMHYAEWQTDESGNVISESINQSIPLTNNLEITVNPGFSDAEPNYSFLFIDDEQINVIISVSQSTNGRVLGEGSYTIENEVTLFAIPNDGYIFEGWYEDGIRISGTEEAYSFTATTDRSLEARFIAYSTDVSFTATQIGGTSGTEDSAGVIITFNQPVLGLLERDITIANGSGVAVKGEQLYGSDETWIIELSSVMTEGNITVSVADFGIYSFTPSPQMVTIYKNNVNDGRHTGNNSGSYIPSGNVTTYSATPGQTTSGTTIPGNGGLVDIPITVNIVTGTVTFNLDNETIAKLINDAIAAAAKQGGEAVPSVIFDLSGVENAKAAMFSADVAQACANAGVAVTIILPAGKVTLSPKALAELADASPTGATLITVEAVVIPMSELRGIQAAQVKGYETVVSINVFVGSAKVDVPLTVRLPYTLKPNENPAAVRVWHISEIGNLKDLNGVFDRATDLITVAINHQSYFVAGYDPVSIWNNIFSDLNSEEWYYYAIAFMNHHGIINGYGNGLVGADEILTRAQFATLLWNFEGNPLPNGTAHFDDVTERSWYYEAITWAAENSVVVGYGNGRFGPNDPITCEQVIQMLYNYAIEFKGYEIPQNIKMPDFYTTDQIAIWAETAVKTLSEAGVLHGLPESDNKLNLKDKTSRGETAQIFMNFLRFVV